jgi:ATP-dependent RNA helicase RhlE
MPFSALGLLPTLAQAAQAKGYAAPTQVQTEMLPAVLQGRDVLAQAPTGSGKTAAFALPLLQRLVQAPNAQPRPVRALVLVPTRELAVQCAAVLRDFAVALPRRVEVALAFGGVSINPQMMALRGGADVVVATPGRLLDLVERGALTLGDVSTLVLDEADRLLEQGFADELSRILALIPPARRTLLFSATFAPAVSRLAEALLRDPARVDVTDTLSERPPIEQRAIEVDTPLRTQLLRHLIAEGAGAACWCSSPRPTPPSTSARS